MKFAMIPINRKYDYVKPTDNYPRRFVRRVLISYENKNKKGVYKQTKIIAKDDYFLDYKSSQKYEFKDDYFVHITDNYNSSYQRHLLNVKRKYMYNEGLLAEKAIEFESDSIEKALVEFFTREELH